MTNKNKMVKEHVMTILEKNNEARRDDKVLIIDYLKTHHKLVYIEELFRPDVPAIASITRHKRKIQNDEHLYPYIDPSTLKPLIIIEEVKKRKQEDYLDIARG